MPDFFIPVPKGAYRLGRTFYRPTDHGSAWSIALEDKYGLVLTAGISVVLTFIFMRIWKLVCFLALTFPRSRSHRRYAALVTIWNSNDPLFAFRELATYSLHYLGHSNGDFAYGFIYCVLAFIVFGSSISLGIVGPTLIQKGNVAPARPSALFYPVLPDIVDIIGEFQRLSLLAPENLRALGSVDIAKPAIRDRVTFSPIWTTENETVFNDTRNVLNLLYGYNVTGVDLGLQHGSNLSLHVSGSCRTEYDWFIREHDNITTEDRYAMWGDEDQVEIVPIDEKSILNTPKLTFWIHEEGWDQYQKDGNVSYAIVITSAHRASITSSSDPWYDTEVRNSTIPFLTDIETFWVKQARPVLSCWEQGTWKYGKNSTTDVRNLYQLPGIKVKSVLLDLLAAVFLYGPILVTIGSSTGATALKPGIGSLFTGEADFIDAAASNIEDDLERLIFASFIKSKNALVDTALFDYRGAAKTVMGPSVTEPLPGAGDFVVQNSKIQTFSMTGLVVLLVALIALTMVEFVMIMLLGLHRSGESQSDSNQENLHRAEVEANTPETPTEKESSTGAKEQLEKGPGPLVLFKVLSASQLFRRIYEPDDKASRKEWACTRQFPEPERSSDGKPKELVHIDGCSQDECKGHIRRPSRAFTGVSITSIQPPKEKQ
ncbi:hypothetical protein PT974_04962 [Cladobotryum mycophilum]|uniref:Uncharacterized protein n=1 Tax=Cladobotryum mycophilum TaxID=491253 RepID=A0ABR0SRY7_9HYPO